MNVAELAAARREEARRSNQRRMLVLAGDREAGLAAAFEALSGADVQAGETTVVSTAPGTALHAAVTDAGLAWDVERVEPTHADRLLGTTRTAVVLDAHDGFSPNVLGRLVGAVDGGGLFVLVAPSLSAWPGRRDVFDERLAVPPFDLEAVGGRFRRRLVETLESHPGIAVFDVDDGELVREGALEPGPVAGPTGRTVPRRHRFPAAAYEACLTGDQARALRQLESLDEPGHAVVVEADRGRGKSSAAGLAAASLAAGGRDVLVTAPEFQSAREAFVRARALLETLDAPSTGHGDDRRLTTAAGGRIRFERPPAAATLPDDPDVVVVDEAAAVPVRLLSQLLGAPAAAFCTTVHGYEGAGRGFSVRFRDRLAASDHAVSEVHMDEPIRYARGDPVESWAFRALLLDARPPVDQLVEEATPETTTYRTLTPETLLNDERLLRETFGLLVLAHYRTEPDDLARLLDAPNLAVRVLTHGGHVVSVALLAREGDLAAETRRRMYEGHRVRGNMIPDVLTSQVRDEAAGVTTGYRVMRIATHHAVRSSGLGSSLLASIRAELEANDPLVAGDADGRAAGSSSADDGVDWLGVGYGATPRLLSFWEDNGYRTVYLSTSRNDRSGEYSVVMLRPVGPRGRALLDRHTDWFVARAPGVLSDALDDLDADVVRAALRATDRQATPSLSDREWRVVADAAYGPGLYTADPGAFRRLALAHLTAPERGDLSARSERLLVRKLLQAHGWASVTAELEYVSTSECMRALGEACQPLVDAYAPRAIQEHAERYR
jgi:tRNA(Met) cytidine acetyltransferase